MEGQRVENRPLVDPQLSQDPMERLAVSKREFGEFGGVNAAVEVATTFTVLKADTLPEIFAGKIGPQGGCYLYGRSFNPTVRHLGRQLAALEGAEAAYCCSSGMAAISSTLLALCNSGDHIVASNAVYGGTFALLKDFLPQKCGISTTFVPIADLDAVKAAITPATKVIYAETLSNPTLVVADLPALAEIAHSRGIQLVVDNTFTPCLMSPLRWGADVVVHSLTKFVSGASDIVAGAVCGRDAFVSSLMDLHVGTFMLLGPTMDPKVASELSLRIPHLGLRMREHSRRAQYFAERLQQLGGQVTYPGLSHHPQHTLFAKLANPGYGFGGMLTLDAGSLERAKFLMERLQNKHGFGLLAVSLGYFDTLLSASASSTSSELSDEELAKAGISRGLVRMSVGITGSMEQRWRQLEESFLAVQSAPAGSRPTFKAQMVVRDPISGQLHRSPSWDSFGSVASDDTGEDDVVQSPTSTSLAVPHASGPLPISATNAALVPQVPSVSATTAEAAVAAGPVSAAAGAAATASSVEGGSAGVPSGTLQGPLQQSGAGQRAALQKERSVNTAAGSEGRPLKVRKLDPSGTAQVVYTLAADARSPRHGGA